MSFEQAYPIGTAGKPWGDAERAAWLAATSVQRSYKDEVLAQLEPLRAQFDVVQYGCLSQDPERYPLFAVKTRGWDSSKPFVLVTGGVHGYEKSGVHGALRFLSTRALHYSERFNIACCPCVSPWGYECIQRWSAKAVDPNRSFSPDRPAEESAQVMDFVASLWVSKWLMHIDLHETTNTDESEFRPAKAARDGVEHVGGLIPDGFYLVGDTEKPQERWHAAMIEAVAQVTHIAPPDAEGKIIGAAVTQTGVITYPTRELFLCSSVTNADFATTTEVYPDSPRASEEQCNEAQVAAVCSGLEFLIAEGL